MWVDFEEEAVPSPLSVVARSVQLILLILSVAAFCCASGLWLDFCGLFFSGSLLSLTCTASHSWQSNMWLFNNLLSLSLSCSDAHNIVCSSWFLLRVDHRLAVLLANHGNRGEGCTNDAIQARGLVSCSSWPAAWEPVLLEHEEAEVGC